MNQTSNKFRVLAVSLSSRGFGYAVLENERTLVEYGKKRIYGDKNAGTLIAIERLIARNLPDFLVLQDVNKAKGTRRVNRIKRLHRRLVALANNHTLVVKIISGWKIRAALIGNENGTKHELAELLASRFPDELASLLPPKRTVSMNADDRMDIFDAVGLAVAFQIKKQSRRLEI